MSSRSTLVLLVLAAALGAWVYFVEIRGGEEKARVEAEEKRLVGFDADEIALLEVPLEDAGFARVVRDANDWRLEEPLAWPADKTTVTGLTTTLATLASELRIDDPGDREIYGLGDASPRVRVATADGREVRLRLGSDTPIGAARYVAVEGQDAVFTVAAANTTSLEPTLLRLRDKRLIGVEPHTVDGVQVRENGALVVELERTTVEPPAPRQDEPLDPEKLEDWQLRKPIQVRGDASRVRRLVQDLSYSRASGFIDAPGEPAEYGLDAPELEIDLRARGDAPGMWTTRLALGRKDGKAFARRDESGVVYEIRDRLLSDVPRGLFPYRFKRVTEIEEDLVRRVIVQFPREGSGAVFTRLELEDPWQAADPNQPVDSLRVADIVFGLASLDAMGIDEQSTELAAVGLDPARVRVELFAGDETSLGWIELGDPDADHGIAARSNGSDTIWRVQNAVGEEVPLGQTAFRNNWLEADEDAGPSGAGQNLE